jgi:hypothetical protein
MKNVHTFESFDISHEGWETPYTNQNESSEMEIQNYMFFQNLMMIKDAINDLLKMDRHQIDQILSKGHGWALDHISTSTDDIEEVYHFLKHHDESESDHEDDYEDHSGSEMPEIEILGNNDQVEIESGGEEE